MLKGTTRIELTDVNTGEVEVHEEHNMVTNALRDILKPLGLSKRPSVFLDNFNPFYVYLTGGIVCFDTKIPEKADEYYPPASANLIACAVYKEQNNTKNTVRGGCNQTESEINLKDRYVKYVYDFATSQGNGTISSICLTHESGSFTSYGSKNAVQENSHLLMQSIAEDTLQYVNTKCTGGVTGSKYSSYTIGKTEMIFLIDRDKDCAYYLKIVDKTHFHITKRRTYLKSVSILDNVKNTKPLIEEISLDALGTELSLNGYTSYNYDPATDCLYVYNSSVSNLKPNGNIIVTEIKMDSWEIKQYTVPNSTDVYLATNNGSFGVVTEGYLMVKAYESPYDIYKFPLNNPADVVKMKRINASTVQGFPKIIVNGRIYYDNAASQLMIANIETNEVMTTESKSLFNNSYRQINVTPVRNEPLIYFTDTGSEESGGWYMLCNYLVTINNLETPVTKTPDKTMKITYILQEQ